MTKGYIYKDDGMWHVGFVTGLDEEGKALFMVHSQHAKWRVALRELIEHQLRAA